MNFRDVARNISRGKGFEKIVFKQAQRKIEI